MKKKIVLLLLFFATIFLSAQDGGKPTKISNLSGTYQGKIKVTLNEKVLVDTMSTVLVQYIDKNKVNISINGVEIRGKKVNLTSAVDIIPNGDKNCFSGDIDMMVGEMKIPAKFEGHELHKKLKVQLSAAFLVVQISGEFNGEKN